MSAVRRFRIASSLVRLIRKERGSSRIMEGFFPPQSGRLSYVSIDGNQCHLVLLTTDQSGAVTNEERTEVPRAHGDALLDVCGGKAVYDRTQFSIGNGRDAVIDRFSAPGALDLASVTFDNDGDAAGFVAPPWFGPEVTGDAGFDTRTIALQGLPSAGEVVLTNAGLEALLDTIENRFAFRYAAQPQAARPPAEDGVMTALKRLAGNVGAPAETPKPVPAAPAEPVPAPPPVAAEAVPEPSDLGSDARIDDVIESLSQALGAVVPAEDASKARPEGEAGSPFERWTVRPRRSQQS